MVNVCECRTMQQLAYKINVIQTIGLQTSTAPVPGSNGWTSCLSQFTSDMTENLCTTTSQLLFVGALTYESHTNERNMPMSGRCLSLPVVPLYGVWKHSQENVSLLLSGSLFHCSIVLPWRWVLRSACLTPLNEPSSRHTVMTRHECRTR